MVNLWDDLDRHQALLVAEGILPPLPGVEAPPLVEQQTNVLEADSSSDSDSDSDSSLSSSMARRGNRGSIPSPAAQAKQARALSDLCGDKTTERDHNRVMQQCKDFSTILCSNDDFDIDRVANWFTFNAHRPKIEQFKEVTVTDRDGRPKKVRKRNPAWKFTREECDRVMKHAMKWKPGDGMPTDAVEGLQNLDLHWSAIQKMCPDQLKQKLRDHSGIQVSDICDIWDTTE